MGTLKEVNPRVFFDDGSENINSEGESGPRQTRSDVLNRLSLSREQIANQGSLDFLMKRRSLKSFAATAIGKYVELSDKTRKVQFTRNISQYLLDRDIQYRLAVKFGRKIPTFVLRF